jgi:hypothetical protein
MLDERKLAALRELLDPQVIAAWLDEVEAHRRRPPALVVQPSECRPVDSLLTVNEVNKQKVQNRENDKVNFSNQFTTSVQPVRF